MRKTFFEELHRQMTLNDKVYALTGDLGYIGFDQIREDYPKRFINCGASEQAMLDMAVGLAYEGKLPFVYTITPFFYRAWETIRTYVNHEKLPIVMVGSGRDKDYSEDGWSHDATDIPKMLELFKNIRTYYPNDKSQIKGLLDTITYEPHPSFISLKR